MSSTASRYFLCAQGRELIELDLQAYCDPFEDVFLSFWVKVCQELDRRTELRGLTFYLVWDAPSVQRLPATGNDVVAVVLMDEWCLLPLYFGRVRFVFKAYGFRPWISGSIRGKNAAVLLRFGRDLAKWLIRLAAFVWHNGPLIPWDKGRTVPLGYARQTDLPVKPFEERRYAVSFLGSVESEKHHPLSIYALLGTPKGIARSAMAQGLKALAARRSDVFCATTGTYAESILSDGASYSQLMAETRICLAPRGSSVETYRFFEALRQGCVIICDRLPPHWFYQGCPAIQIDHWGAMEGEVTALLADPGRLFALHRASLAWWHAKCSEQATATFIAEQLVHQGSRHRCP